MWCGIGAPVVLEFGTKFCVPHMVWSPPAALNTLLPVLYYLLQPDAVKTMFPHIMGRLWQGTPDWQLWTEFLLQNSGASSWRKGLWGPLTLLRDASFSQCLLSAWLRVLLDPSSCGWMTPSQCPGFISCLKTLSKHASEKYKWVLVYGDVMPCSMKPPQFLILKMSPVLIGACTVLMNSVYVCVWGGHSWQAPERLLMSPHPDWGRFVKFRLVPSYRVGTCFPLVS